MDKFIPIWKNKRYSIGYFIAGLKDMRMYFGLSLISGYFWDGLHGVWTTVKAVIQGKALRYRWKDK